MDENVDPTDLFRSPTRSFGARTDEQLPPLAVELVVDEDDEENTLYTYSHTTQYFTRTQILKLMLAWIRNHQHDRRNAHTDAALDDEIPTPTYHPDKPGSYWGIFKTKKKFADDCYAPWCLTQDGKQRRPRSNNAPLKFEECEVFVREKRIEHPKQSDFHKQTMSISHMPEAENVVFIMYSFCVEDMILPPVAKPKPSQEMRNIVVQACEGRTFQKALEFIPDHVRQKLQMKQIRNIAKRVESYVKTKCGAAPTTDPLELITLSSSISGFQGTVTDVYIDPKKQKAGQPKTRKVAEITYLCEDAFRAFLKGCATLDKIKAHHKECKRIETMRSLQEQTSECNNLLTSLTESQLIRGVAGVVQIDTTFGLSGLFVTLIVGVLTQFVTNQSRKNRPIILGFLMHSDRKVHHHTNMARRIDDMISHIDSTKFISAYITDGEASLKEMCTGPAFSHAVHLRCDVHRRKNMLFKIERLLPPEDVKEFEVKMFGTKWKNSLGETVHIGGAFAKMDMKRFKQELSHMKEYFNHPQISSLLDRKAESYYYANSMMAKLRGGVLCQWVTTNIIEGMNHLVQRRIPRREAGHVTAQKLVQFIKDSVTELWKAAITDSSEVLVAPTSTHGASTYLNWFKMKRPGKMEVINFFGLPEKMTGKDSNLPQWVHENYDNIENYLGKYTVEILMDGNSFLMYKTGDKLSSITLMIRNDYVVCGDRNCKDVYRHTKITPCRHIIAVLSSMHSNISHTFWKKYELNFEQLSPQQRLALTQSGGDGTKRIGNPRSKHNDIRTTDFVSHSVYNNPAVESHTVDDSLDDIQSSPILPKRRIQQKPPAAIQNLSTTSLFDDSDLHKGAIERLGLTRALDEGSTLAVKKKTPAPTRAVTSTTKPKKQTLVESHTVDDSLDDIQSSPVLPKRRIQQKPPAAIQNLSTTSLFDDSDLHKGAIERLGLTRALDEGSTLAVKKKTPAPTRAVTSTTKPKKQTLVESHTVDDSLDDIQSSPVLPKRRIQQKPPAAIQNLSTTSLFDDSDLHKGAIERLGLTRALDEGSTLAVKKKTPAPTRAVTSTTKPKKQTLVESHTVDDSLDDIQSSPVLPKRRIQQKPPAAIQNLSTTSLFDDSDLHKGAIERLGLTRALDEGSTLTVKKKTPAPTRAVTSTTKPKKQTLGVSHAVAPTRAATTRTKPSGLVKTKEKAARLTIDGFSRNVKRKPKHLGWSDDDMGESDLILQHESPTQHSPTQYSPTPYYDHNYSRETEIHIVEEENTVEEPFAYGNIGEAMFPEFIDNDFASAEARLEQVEIARRQYANVEKERKRSPTPLLINEKPNYETLDAKPAKLPRLEAPLINSTRPSCEPRDPLLLNETPNYEQLDVKPARLTRLEAARLNSTRPCYEEVKPQTLPRRVLSPRDVRNFYSKKKDIAPTQLVLVQLPHKATPARRSLRLAGSSAAVEEKPSGVVEEPVESDAPKIKSRGGPRKILLQRQ